ncbi:MAG: hypothetical protein ACE5FG_04035 [Myxococcota bacterium]
MYTPTTFANPSAQAEALSRELDALIRTQRAQNPTLGLPDVLVAMELAKAGLLDEAGLTAARSRVLGVALAALIVGVSAFLFFAAS